MIEPHLARSESAFSNLVESPWLRRLDRISFLGTLDVQPDVRARPSRLDHSIAVARRATDVARAASLDDRASRAFVVAALLHDIGHFPLSHSAEAAFARAWGGSHHDVSRWIVLGEGPVSSARSLRPALEKLHVEPDVVWALVSGTAQSEVPRGIAALLTAVLNLDTFDGVCRVAHCFGKPHEAPSAAAFSFEGDDIFLRPAAIRIADSFWRLKDEVYVSVVNRPSNILLEEWLTAAVTDDARLTTTLESLDDAVLLARHPYPARDAASDDSCYAVVEDMEGPRLQKRYFVDTSVQPRPEGLRFRDWARRYVHRRERVRLVRRGCRP